MFAWILNMLDLQKEKAQKQLTIMWTVWDFRPILTLMDSLCESRYISFYPPLLRKSLDISRIFYLGEKCNSIFFLPLKFFKRTISIVRHIVVFKPDIVVSHHDDANISVLPALFVVKYLLRKNIKFVAYIHNWNYDESLFSRFIALVAQYFYHHFDQVITVSEGNKFMLEKRLWLKNIKVFYNPVDIGLIDEKSKESIDLVMLPNRKVICTISRLTHQKWLDRLLEALALFKEKYALPFVLRIIGTWELEETLQKQIVSLWLEKEVYLFGMQENVFPYINACDVFVLNSRWESFGQVLVEALALNKVIVSSDCDYGPREILCPAISDYKTELRYPYFGEYGILVSHPDRKKSISSLASTLYTVFNDHAIIKQYSHVWRKRALDFDITSMKSLYRDYFSSFGKEQHNH